MDKFKKREYSLKEKELLAALDKIEEKIKQEKVVGKLLENDTNLLELLNHVNRLIEEYSIGANELLENSKTTKAARYIDRLEKLIALRDDINNYYENSNTSYQDLLDLFKKNFLKELKDSVFEKEFFDSKIFTEEELNEEVINKILNKLDNPTFMKYLKKNISLKEDYQANRKIYLECINILENENKIINSIEDIASIRFIYDRTRELLKELEKYTNLDEELITIKNEVEKVESSLVNSKLLSKKLTSEINDYEMKTTKRDNINKELEELKVEYQSIYNRLEELSLSRYITKDNPDNPLDMDLCNIEKAEDLDKFFKRIELLKKKIYKKLVDIVNKLTALNELSERDALEFANSDIKTTYNLLELRETNINGISSEVVIYILKRIIELENLSNIKVDIYMCSSLLDDEIDEFYIRYFDIMGNKKTKNKRL